MQYGFCNVLRKQAEALDAQGKHAEAMAVWDELDAELADMRFQQRMEDARAERSGWDD